MNNEEHKIGVAHKVDGNKPGLGVVMHPPIDEVKPEEVADASLKIVESNGSILLSTEAVVIGEETVKLNSEDIDTLLDLAALTHIVHKEKKLNEITSIALLNLLLPKTKGNLKEAIETRLLELK